MSALYSTHAWVEFTEARNPALAQAGTVHVLSISESSSLSGPQQLQVTLPGRTEQGRLWTDLITLGDLCRVGLQRVEDGRVVRATVAEDCMIADRSLGETLADGQYQMTLSLSADSLQSLLMTDAVAWWMYYGTQVGALRARGELLPDDASGQLDKVLANYLNKVALNRANWVRDDVGLSDRLGYHLRALRPNVPILKDLSIAEGAHWDIMARHAELNLHEFFVAQRVPTAPFVGGYVHHPRHHATVVASSDDAGSGDGSRPYVILRPKPYPYADRSGHGVLSEWNALPLHDLTDVRATVGSRGWSDSISSVRNFFMVFPGYDAMNDQMAFTLGLAVYNPASIKRYTYRPVKAGTNLVLNAGSKDTMLDLAQELTWRMAGQMNRLDEMQSGSIQVPAAPEIQQGDRVRFVKLLSDGSSAGVHQGYVTGRSHTYQRGRGALSTVQLERVLPDAAYQKASYFVDGLEKVDLNWPGPRHGY